MSGLFFQGGMIVTVLWLCIVSINGDAVDDKEFDLPESLSSEMKSRLSLNNDELFAHGRRLQGLNWDETTDTDTTTDTTADTTTDTTAETSSLHDGRAEQLGRMGSYSLVHFDYSYSNNTMRYKSLKFEYDNDWYKLELTLNTMLVASNVVHTNGVFKDSKHGGYFTSLTQSCHYHADVFKYDSDDSELVNAVNVGSGSVSICDKRGVWGELRIGESNGEFNDALVIAPAKYYLDYEYHKSEDKFHDISHEHLIYRISNFNTTGMPDRFRLARRTIPGQNDMGDDDGGSASQRKLLATYNEGASVVEMYLFADKSQYSKYKSQSGGNWYDELAATFFDYVNGVSDIYSSTNWGSQIGTISVRIKEIEAAQNWVGKYSKLKPSCPNGVCDANLYMDNFEQFVIDNKNFNSLDSFFTITQFNIGAGLANKGSMCTKSKVIAETPSGGMQDKDSWGVFYNMITLAHEMGHGFGMPDESNKRIMGTGEIGKFAASNIQQLKTHFSKSSVKNMACLGDFTCDNGCSIDSEYYNDGSWCDCKSCEDEDYCSCPNGGCPKTCGDYKDGSCSAQRTDGFTFSWTNNGTEQPHDFGDDTRELSDASDTSGGNISNVAIVFMVVGVVVFVVVGTIVALFLMRKNRLHKRMNEYKQAPEYEPPIVAQDEQLN